jgi:uncharacterized delta-60 repeat protein
MLIDIITITAVSKSGEKSEKTVVLSLDNEGILCARIGTPTLEEAIRICESTLSDIVADRFNNLTRQERRGLLDAASWDGESTSHDFRAVAVAPDGCVYVTGSFFSGGAFSSVIMKYSSNLELLNTIRLEDHRLLSLAIAIDGSILAAGSFEDWTSDTFFETAVLMRLNSDLELLGRVTRQKGYNDAIIAITVAPDGSVYAIGRSEDWKNPAEHEEGFRFQPFIALYSDDLKLLTDEQAPGDFMGLRSLAIAPNGLVYVGGSVYSPDLHSAYPVIIKYSSSLVQLDMAVLDETPDTYSSVNCLAITPDGTIYAGGFGSRVLMRLNSDMQTINTSVPLSDYWWSFGTATALFTTTDGSIYACGYNTVVRFNHDLQQVESVFWGGVRNTHFWSMANAPDGSVYVVGSVDQNNPKDPPSSVAIIRRFKKG